LYKFDEVRPVIESKEIQKPLSERPLGYFLAVLGGLIGSPLGLLTSPGVLFLLNKNMKGKEGKQPNRFAVWALIGILGAPINLAINQAIGNLVFKKTLAKDIMKPAQ
jgi:hypothetical protein